MYHRMTMGYLRKVDNQILRQNFKVKCCDTTKGHTGYTKLHENTMFIQLLPHSASATRRAVEYNIIFLAKRFVL